MLEGFPSLWWSDVFWISWNDDASEMIFFSFSRILFILTLTLFSYEILHMNFKKNPAHKYLCTSDFAFCSICWCRFGSRCWLRISQRGQKYVDGTPLFLDCIKHGRTLRDVTQSFVKSQCEAPCGGLGRRHLGSVRLHQCACSVIKGEIRYRDQQMFIFVVNLDILTSNGC